MERLFTTVDRFCMSDSPKTTKSYRTAMVQFGQSKYGAGLTEAANATSAHNNLQPYQVFNMFIKYV